MILASGKTVSCPLILSAASKTLFSNTFYRLETDVQGHLTIRDVKGQPVVLQMQYELQATSGGFEGFQHIESRQPTASGLELICFSPQLQLDLTFELSEHSPKITLNTRSTYLTSAAVERESLIFNLHPPVREVYKKNRQVDSRALQRAYWLDRQGVKFGSGASCFFCYHSQGLSSLYLDVTAKKLWANLDDQRDHPHIGPHPTATYADRSASHHPAGSALLREWMFYVGEEPALFPRLMLHPHGYLATYVWTEHACFSDYRLHKAVYYGSESIHDPAHATGGFVKHGIPVTKSVFYANDCAVKNDGQSRRFTGPMVAIQGNPAFAQYLDDLERHGGYEICLHCPQPETSPRDKLVEALDYMKKRFNAKSWIDHIWLKPKGQACGCGEGFSYQGTDEGQADTRALWQRYGTRYFWNCCFEYFGSGRRSYKKLLQQGQWLETGKEFGRRLWRKLFHRISVLDLFYSYYGTDETPTPLYWRHPTLYPQLIAWPTRKSHHPSKNDKRHAPHQLQKLLRNWGVCFNHSYPVYIGESNAAWSADDKGHVTVSPEFDGLLQRMAALRDQGLLNLSLIRDVLAYWEHLEGIRIEYHPHQPVVTITNTTNTDIQGLSLVAKASHIFVNDKVPSLRRCGDDLIFWFDLAAGTSARIRAN